MRFPSADQVFSSEASFWYKKGIVWTQSISWAHLGVDDHSVYTDRGLPAIARFGSRSLEGSLAKGKNTPTILDGSVATQHWLVEMKRLISENIFLWDTTAAGIPAYDSFATEERCAR